MCCTPVYFKVFITNSDLLWGFLKIVRVLHVDIETKITCVCMIAKLITYYTLYVLFVMDYMFIVSAYCVVLPDTRFCYLT